MSEFPCWDCQHSRRLVNTSDSIRETLGTYVCIEDAIDAIVIDEPVQKFIKLRGCNKEKKEAKK
jgi:hypothetical protein